MVHQNGSYVVFIDYSGLRGNTIKVVDHFYDGIEHDSAITVDRMDNVAMDVGPVSAGVFRSAR